MNYITIELQTNNGTTANIVNAYDKLAQAESHYHQALSAAAVSNVERHACVILDETGMVIAQRSYDHVG